MGWLKTGMRMPNRGAILTLHRQSEEGQMWEAAARKIGERFENPPNYPAEAEAVEKAAYDLLVKIRPDLAGFTLWYWDFNPARYEYEFGVAHHELPLVEPGEMFQRVPLRDRVQIELPG